jgi:hypothetical protein
MDKPWKVIFAFVGVFIAGAIFGGVFTRGAAVRRLGIPPQERPLVQLPPANQPPPQVAGPQAPAQKAPMVRHNPITPRLMRELIQKLSLTPEQQKKIRPLVGRAGEDLDRMRLEGERMRQENIAAVRRVTERMYADVSDVLTLEQRAGLEQMRKQEEERVQNDARKRREAAAAAAEAQRAANPAPNRPNTVPQDTP